MQSYERDGLIFDVRDLGKGPPVVLLHGWPGGASTWDETAEDLRRRGLRTLVPDQRGYSPRARPAGSKPYVLSELVADLVALLDAAELPSAHLVGHDWGGAVAWATASTVPERLASLTVLSTPHPRAMARALWSSDQGLRSAYIAGFQLPVVPERLLLAGGGGVLRRVLERSGLSTEKASQYTERQRSPGALTASLAWYRALRFGGGSGGSDLVAVPTLYVWSSGDAALGRRAAELTGDHVSGPYRFKVLDGVSHWIPEERPALVAELVADHVAANPVRPST